MDSKTKTGQNFISETQYPDKIIEALSIDCVIFSFKNSHLQILLVKHGEGIGKGKWALPGGWIKYNEHLDSAAYRLLEHLTGVKDVYLEQLQAFGNTDRYPGKRVITIAFFALIQSENYELHPGFTAADAKWFDIQQLPDLLYDHNRILRFGYEYLKLKVRHEPIGFNLLPEKFTLLQLQELYEAILEVKLDKPNFRRKIMKMNLIIDCKEKQQNVSHRAANLYRFDESVYNRLKKEGFNFEF
ncbi:NUDIX domain-containing protein [Rapidithrix thailandica]|uniref:NUDIX domain-containing protein n=1 Tax=Rapidithrix thailandica TaxID=413964 RepID=A0AAW9S8H1_9BACT